MSVCDVCEGSGKVKPTIRGEAWTCLKCNGTGEMSVFDATVLKLELTRPGDILVLKFTKNVPQGFKTELAETLERAGHRGTIVIVGKDDDIEMERQNDKDSEKAKV